VVRKAQSVAELQSNSGNSGNTGKTVSGKTADTHRRSDGTDGSGPKTSKNPNNRKPRKYTQAAPKPDDPDEASGFICSDDSQFPSNLSNLNASQYSISIDANGKKKYKIKPQTVTESIYRAVILDPDIQDPATKKVYKKMDISHLFKDKGEKGDTDGKSKKDNVGRSRSRSRKKTGSGDKTSGDKTSGGTKDGNGGSGESAPGKEISDLVRKESKSPQSKSPGRKLQRLMQNAIWGGGMVRQYLNG
jgi:hypothetical protein